MGPEKSRIWELLTNEEKQSVLDAYEESEDDNNLISLEDAINKLPGAKMSE
jgi:DNA-directed RNA polymerase subunit H (RpoH/RPB5)